MRNYDFEVEEIIQDIKTLQSALTVKRHRLNTLRKKEKAPIEEAREIIRDHFGKPIRIGDWVCNVIKKGIRIRTKGTIIDIKRCVTFCDREGVKQFIAPHNLIISDLPASEHDRK